MHFTTRRLVVGAVALAVLSATLGGLVGAGLRSDPDTAAERPASSGAGCDVAEVSAAVLPSLVTIHVRGPAGSGNGSGSVLDQQGNILTNDHVIAQAVPGGTVTVDFARGYTQVAAAIVGRDPATDLAVVRAQPPGGGLVPIALGDSAALIVGQPVVAAGSPLGLSGTITAGVVSALNRYVDVGEGARPATLVNTVQTDAAINPGNSGGPLTDCAGRQIAVNTAGAQVPGGGGGSIGLNFAIPITFANAVADELIENGRATHPTIGVLAVTVTDEMASATGLPRGARVEQVLPGLGAAAARIQAGDVITRIGDAAVNSVDQMQVAIRSHNPGDTVPVSYTRGGAAQTANVAVTAA
ncbi:S1C family serine protease [Phytohabitans houttuyneae]|uniref:Serine protease n=1 Tax=Phytohabitans houttuyneae TaxID=1076126 RepID=A0A6V8K8P8_9ACTN|nr:trypsin-like peptidase domain-containing protein [Phytohabitans houttuyneae]GFJ81573.1 serine protease [Phytohabitans houttuyneae]